MKLWYRAVLEVQYREPTTWHEEIDTIYSSAVKGPKIFWAGPIMLGLLVHTCTCPLSSSRTPPMSWKKLVTLV